MSELAAKVRSARATATHGGALLGGAARQWTGNLLAQRLPRRPEVLQLPVNDICNSQCVMCNIWQQKRDDQITPSQLDTVLADRLFARIRHVGINGGEPTLRDDLPALGEALVRRLPRLRAVHIITNALKAEQVIARVGALHDALAPHGVSLTVGVSLDGVGRDHDDHRGVRGNFAAAEEVINILRDRGLEISLGCTLTALNCDGADDLLAWSDARGWAPPKFRLGVEIRRVYNEGFNLLYPLTAAQRFHLVMFFDKLARNRRIDTPHRRFYASLVDQMAFGAPRRAGCHWQTRGVTLDARGGLSYCSVENPDLGNALTTSAASLYRRGVARRRAIVRDACNTCHHDLMGPPAPGQLVREGVAVLTEPVRRRVRPWLQRARRAAAAQARPASLRPPRSASPAKWHRILITGWYGTETAGDKAILAELHRVLGRIAPDAELAITTLDRKVSLQTAGEISALSGTTTIDFDTAHRPAVIDGFDAVIVGGGPIEHNGRLEQVRRIFRRANRRGMARVLFGCGVGPLHDDAMRRRAAEILGLATHGFFRDEESRETAAALGAGSDLAVACDPALRYMVHHELDHGHAGTEGPVPVIAALLRANTREYRHDLSSDRLAKLNEDTARACAQLLDAAHDHGGWKAHLLPMHTLWQGGDDRAFHRDVERHCGAADWVRRERAYLTFDVLMAKLGAAGAALTMRYHAHLACLARGIPMVSLDYTGDRGKVAALVRRLGWSRWCVPWPLADGDDAARRLRDLLDARTEAAARLVRHRDAMVRQLESVYTDTLGWTPRRRRHGSLTRAWRRAA